MILQWNNRTNPQLIGGLDHFHSHVVAATVTAPVFAGTIPDISEDFDTGTHQTDLSTYFTGATSYSISPSVEAGWTFNTSTGVLTIDTDEAASFGPYTVTGTNTGGSDSSNAFNVTVTDAQATGGFWRAYQYQEELRKKEEEERKRLKAKAEEIQNKLDRELALELQKDESEYAKIQELERLTVLAEQHLEYIDESLSEKVNIAAKRAIKQGNFSAMEALQRELRKAREEEIFLIQATMIILH